MQFICTHLDASRDDRVDDVEDVRDGNEEASVRGRGRVTTALSTRRLPRHVGETDAVQAKPIIEGPVREG